MAAPSLPGLHFGTVTKIGTLLISTWLDAVYEALLHLTSGTYDDGATIPAASKWVVSRYQNAGLTEAVYCEPAASSPIAGKVVLIWAGAAAGTHASVVMAGSDTYANGVVLFGMYVANAGATVSRSNYSAWDAATPFSGGTGRFTGYVRVTATTAWSRAILFASAEYLALNCEITGGACFTSFGGAGISGIDDNTTDSESGLGGRVFDFGCSGSGTACASDFWNSVASSSGMFLHSASSGQAHWFVLAPGTSTIKGILYRANTSSAGALNNGDNNNCLSPAGYAQPDVLPIRDISGSATNARKWGRHRAFFYGPRRKSSAILSFAGVKSWVAFGAHTVSDSDAAALPY